MSNAFEAQQEIGAVIADKLDEILKAMLAEFPISAHVDRTPILGQDSDERVS